MLNNFWTEVHMKRTKRQYQFPLFFLMMLILEVKGAGIEAGLFLLYWAGLFTPCSEM